MIFSDYARGAAAPLKLLLTKFGFTPDRVAVSGRPGGCQRKGTNEIATIRY